jgi:hypothetical protein
LLLWKKNKFIPSLSTAGRSLRAYLISLRLCAFARQKKQITHTKALRVYLISLRLSAAPDRSFLLGEKKKVSAQSRQDAKGFSLHSKK